MSDRAPHRTDDEIEPRAFVFDVDYRRLPLARLIAEARDHGPFRGTGQRGVWVWLGGYLVMAAAFGLSLAAGQSELDLVAVAAVVIGGVLLYAGDTMRSRALAAQQAGARWFARPRRIVVDPHGLDEGEGGGRVPWAMVDGVDTLGDCLAFWYRGTVLFVPFTVSEDVDETNAMIDTIAAWHASGARA